ncbi:MAG: ECF transporter S component [Firmicutes bacterium]|nr:ECF transporter S component [Bacillota bacterium]
MKNSKTARLVTASLLTAACFVATTFISFRSPVQGNINAGDAIVLLSAFLLGPYYGAAAAGIGSALSDLLAGYTVYAPATLVIKALMAVVAALVFRALGKKHLLAGAIVGALAAEAIMIGGYFLFDTAVFGIAVALPNVLTNGIQAAFAIAVGVPLFLAVRRFVKV